METPLSRNERSSATPTGAGSGLEQDEIEIILYLPVQPRHQSATDPIKPKERVSKCKNEWSVVDKTEQDRTQIHASHRHMWQAYINH